LKWWQKKRGKNAEKAVISCTKKKRNPYKNRVLFLIGSSAAEKAAGIKTLRCTAGSSKNFGFQLFLVILTSPLRFGARDVVGSTGIYRSDLPIRQKG
jgi:hypothetical protein